MTSIILGSVFGNLTVVEKTDERKSNEIVWKCVCKCGNGKMVKTSHLKNGSVKSCGCLLHVRGRGRLTTEQFIAKANEIHGAGKYIYDGVSYTGSQDMVTIGCQEHGDFEQIAAIHLAGSGCQKCAGVRMGAKHTISKPEFLEKARERHGDKYDYRLMSYSKCTEYLTIRCTIHDHIFEQKGSYHLLGNEGCSKCRGKIYNKEDFIKKSNEIHGEGSYDYSKVEYAGSKKKVTLICAEGHEFQQTPHNHTAGKHGCPTCGACGFDPAKESFFYILSSGNLTKIGITNRSAKTRISTINKSSGLDFKIVAEYPLEGKFCNKLETELLRLFKKTYKNPNERFDGFSETFVDLDAEEVVDMVECLI
jgi:hypothetical protein